MGAHKAVLTTLFNVMSKIYEKFKVLRRQLSLHDAYNGKGRWKIYMCKSIQFHVTHYGTSSE